MRTSRILDYRNDTAEFDPDQLSQEAFEYLSRSGALTGPPCTRLAAMNSELVDLYRRHGVDLARQPLEIALCAQHNNGGLSGTIWYESVNVSHLFPIGEVNGSHGVARPGGSALNAGQVGAFRAAAYIAHHYRHSPLDQQSAELAKDVALESLQNGQNRSGPIPNWREQRQLFRERMSRFAGVIRSADSLRSAENHAKNQYEFLSRAPLPKENIQDRQESLRNRQLCLAHWFYLSAIRFQVESGTGSRGSSLVREQNIDTSSNPEKFPFMPENTAFRDLILETVRNVEGPCHRWSHATPIPADDDWFESVWKDFRENRIIQ